jgi:hypothetical protein
MCHLLLNKYTQPDEKINENFSADVGLDDDGLPYLSVTSAA